MKTIVRLLVGFSLRCALEGSEMKLLLTLVLLAGLASAGDLTGKWTGTLEFKDDAGELVSVPVTAELRHESQELRGILRSGSREGSIRNAKFEGDRIVFEVTDPESDTPARFSVTAKADSIRGDVVRRSSDGEMHSSKIALSRTK
jgi:hypothetical protein